MRFLVLIALVFAAEADHHDWSYLGENGPENWSRNYPECAGRNQSPIQINHDQTQRTSFEPLRFTGYDTVRSGMTIVNNGHTAQLELAEGDQDVPCIEGAGLDAPYCFAQLHFHWGLQNSEGSEHILDQNFGRALEVHFVHLRPNATGNGATGIAVLGLLFHAIDRNNSAYQPITDALSNIKFNGQRTTVGGFSLDSLLPCPFFINQFYRYSGSLTTPPCTEGVIWTVFEYIAKIGNEQMTAFRELYKTAEGAEPQELMAPNFRPVQELNGRTVFRRRGSIFSNSL